MILFLEFGSTGRRGGEIYTRRLHEFLRSRRADLYPRELTPLPESARSRRRQITYCLSLVKKHRPRAIICDTSSAVRNALAVRYARSRGCKLIVVVQGDRTSHSPRSRPIRRLTLALENYLMGAADVIIANSRFTAHLAAGSAARDAEIVIACPGLSGPIPPPNPDRCVEHRPLRLLYVGECSTVKGLQVLAAAMSLLKSPGVVLDVAGGASQEPKYMQLVREFCARKGISDRVHFHGYVDGERLSALYRNASILVIPSLSEGYGMVAAEGLAHGLPVVASDVGGLPEILVHGRNALLVPSGGPRELASALEQLLEDPSLQLAMSRANLERARELPTWTDFRDALDARLIPWIIKHVAPPV